MRLGEKSQQVLKFVASYVESEGCAPSYREIAEACDIKSTSTVTWHLDRLVKAKYLRRKAHASRALVVLATGTPVALDVLKE